MQTSLISFIVRWRLDGEEIKNDGGMLRNHGVYFYAVGSDSSGKEAVACHLHVLAAVSACFFLSKLPPGILPPLLRSRDLLLPWIAPTPGWCVAQSPGPAELTRGSTGTAAPDAVG